MRTPLSPLALLLIAVAACDPVGTACTEIGCISQLDLTITADGHAVPEFSGSITIGDTEFAVACDGTDATGSDAGVTCVSDGVVSVTFPEGAGDVSWSLVGSDPADTGGFGYDGAGTVTPTWETSQPNGPDCPPTCSTAAVTIALDVLD